MISHNRPTLGTQEADIAVSIIKSNLLTTGEEVKKFEGDVSDFFGGINSVAVSSGSAALFLALWSLNARDKTIAIPVYACSSLRNAVSMIGGRIVYIDNQLNSVNMDIDRVNEINPDIVIVPHLYGIPADIQRINKNILVIEDCAQSLGAKIDGVMTGFFGDVSILSFYSTKLITSGGHGGMVISKNKDMIDNIRDYREFDCRNDNKIRFNFQMTDLQAGIGRIQLEKLPLFLEKRKSIYERYKSEGWPLVDSDFEGCQAVRFKAVLRTLTPEKIIDKLKHVGIKSIVPIEDWELLSDDYDKFIHAYSLAKSTISLPIYPSLSDTQIEFIVKEVNEIL